MKWSTQRNAVDFLYDDHEQIKAAVVRPPNRDCYWAKVWAHNPYHDVTGWVEFKEREDAKVWAVAIARLEGGAS